MKLDAGKQTHCDYFNLYLCLHKTSLCFLHLSLCVPANFYIVWCNRWVLSPLSVLFLQFSVTLIVLFLSDVFLFQCTKSSRNGSEQILNHCFRWPVMLHFKEYGSCHEKIHQTYLSFLWRSTDFHPEKKLSAPVFFE